MGPLPRRRGSALAHGCGRGGRGALPLARAAAVSTGSRVRAGERGRRLVGAVALRPARALPLAEVRLVGGRSRGRPRASVRVRVRLGLGFGFGLG